MAGIVTDQRVDNRYLLAQRQAQGIPAADLKKLVEGGIHTVEKLAHSSKKELLLVKGLSEAKVEKLQNAGVI